MLTDYRLYGGYGEQHNYESMKDMAPQSGQKEDEGSFRKSGDDSEENWARIELGTNKLYKYRKYDVRLLVKKIARIRSGVSEIDVLKSLLSAKCCCERTRSEPFCNKCRAAKVISLDTAKNTQSIKVDRGEYEIYTCVITSKCSSSRDHIHASLVLVVDGYPFTKPLVSTPFGLFSREKKSEKRQSNALFVNPVQKDLSRNEHPEHNFGYSELGRESEGSRANYFPKSTYPEYRGEQGIAVGEAKSFTEYAYDTGSFAGMESTAMLTSVAMPTELFDNTGMFDYDNYANKGGNYADPGCAPTKEITQQHQQHHQQKYQAPLLPQQQMPTGGLDDESNEDFRYLMPEYFVACIQQNCLTLGPPPGSPSIAGTGEGAPNPSDCL